jgi:hypothetical protein
MIGLSPNFETGHYYFCYLTTTARAAATRASRGGRCRAAPIAPVADENSPMGTQVIVTMRTEDLPTAERLPRVPAAQMR